MSCHCEWEGGGRGWAGPCRGRGWGALLARLTLGGARGGPWESGAQITCARATPLCASPVWGPDPRPQTYGPGWGHRPRPREGRWRTWCASPGPPAHGAPFCVAGVRSSTPETWRGGVRAASPSLCVPPRPLTCEGLHPFCWGPGAEAAATLPVTQCPSAQRETSCLGSRESQIQAPGELWEGHRYSAIPSPSPPFTLGIRAKGCRPRPGPPQAW